MGQEESSLGGSDVGRLGLLLALAKLEQDITQQPAEDESQSDHAWDPEDCSPNITLRENDRLAKRNDNTLTTDMVRATTGYTRGIHIWEILWKKEHRGSHAVIGVASYDAPLQCAGYSALLGSNDESLGWNIVANVSLFNDCVINKYPDDVKQGFEAPDVIRVILNMDEGTLRFQSGVDGTDYGLCLSGLNAFSRNGQKLYPAISVTKDDAEIGIKYLGSAEPIYDAVGETSGAAEDSIVFHSEVGVNVELSNGRRTARRTRGYNNGVVMSNRPLKQDEYFAVKLDKIESLPTKYTLDIGVTTNSPEKLNFPETMTDCKQEQTWMICGSQLVLNRQEIDSFANVNLNDLQEGSTVGLMRSTDGKLHIFVDGCLKAKCNLPLPPTIYAVVDMFGKGCKVTITEGSGDDAAGNVLLPTAAKSPTEVIADKLEKMIVMMNKKNPREISTVGDVLTIDVQDVCGRLSTPIKQMMADRFKDMGGATAIAGYIMFLKDTGMKHKEVLRCYFQCLNILLSLTHISLNFATALGETDAFTMLLEEVEKLRTRCKSDKDNSMRVVYALGVLHNCSKGAANVPALRKAGAKGILMKYCDPGDIESSIAYFALLTVINIMVGFEVKSLEVHDNMLATMVKYTADAAADADKHSATVAFASAELVFSFYAIEQVDAIRKLSKNPKCRVSMVKKKVTKHLVQLMETGDQTEQELACNAVWELLSEQTADDVVMSPRLTDVVGKMKDSGVREVADAAKRLDMKIRQLLRRSRVGGAQQVMPGNTVLVRSCKYKDLCQRYVKTLNIPDITWNEKWHQCYCSDCHAAKEDDNYYTRGDPPKEYGIPVGWYRSGIQVLDRVTHRFDKWHRGFHGTKEETVAKIIDIGELVMPGDTILGGDKIGERPGHFDNDWKPKDFKTRQIFVSPSIRYAGHHSYATPTKYVDEETKVTYNSQVALQVLIAPESYTVGGATVERDQLIDPRFSNQEIEWATNQRGSVVLYGLLVKVEESIDQTA